MKSIKAILLLLSFLTAYTAEARTDSTGIETVNGQTFVIHKVESGEGLYGLARKYSSTVAEIQKANTLTSTSLSIGQIVRIPSSRAKAEATTSKTIVTNPVIAEAKKTPAKPANISSTKNPVVHSVISGETLFSIARKYSVTVDQVKNWNSLKTNTVSVGQKLRVNVNIPENSDEPLLTGNMIKDAETKSPIKSKENKYLQSIEYAETGVATWINDKTLNPQKSIALHKTASIGTIIRVTNLLNNKSVYVKVIGTLPETGDNENTVIVVSRAAANMLEVKDPKFRVSLNYSVAK